MIRQEASDLCVSLSEVQAYARVETGEEEALLAGLLRTASEMCETFLNQALVARDFEIAFFALQGLGYHDVAVRRIRADPPGAGFRRGTWGRTAALARWTSKGRNTRPAARP